MDSVVWIICRNEQFYIDMAIDSVVNRPGVGLYILDTGSTDGTFLKIWSYQKRFPNIVFEQKDFGGDFRFSQPNAHRQVEARNYAMDRAIKCFDPKKFIICLDGDEIFNDRFFEILNTTEGDCLVHSTSLLITPRTVSNHPLDMEMRDGIRLFDPHHRAWKANLPVQWIEREGRHMVPRFPGGKDIANSVVTKDHVHFHLHHSFGPKCVKPGSTDDLLWSKSKRFEVPLSHPIPEYTVKRWERWERTGK